MQPLWTICTSLMHRLFSLPVLLSLTHKPVHPPPATTVASHATHPPSLHTLPGWRTELSNMRRASPVPCPAPGLPRLVDDGLNAEREPSLRSTMPASEILSSGEPAAQPPCAPGRRRGGTTTELGALESACGSIAWAALLPGGAEWSGAGPFPDLVCTCAAPWAAPRGACRAGPVPKQGTGVVDVGSLLGIGAGSPWSSHFASMRA